MVVVFGGCFNDGNCLITATNYMHIQFKKESNKLDTAVYFSHISISGANAILFTNDTLVNEILLPLDIHSDSTEYIFQYVNAPADTFRVGYTAQSKVIAKDCGAFTYYQNLKVLHTNLKGEQIKPFNTSLLIDPTVGQTPSAYAVNYQILY
jgi:hypothetical protein